jgi:hypothetical protein
MIKSLELVDRLSLHPQHENVRFYCPINKKYYYIYVTSYHITRKAIHLTNNDREVHHYAYNRLISELTKYTTCFDDIHFIDRDQGIDFKVL